MRHWLSWNCSDVVDDFGNSIINPAAQWRRAFYHLTEQLFGDEV